MIFLVRHTTPVISKEVCYGQTDVAVADSYASELAGIRQHLPADLAVCYSSPLSRCSRLARDIATNVITDARLQELNFGEWELRHWKDLDLAGVEWGNNFVTARPPGGETFLELQQRVLEFWQTFVAKNEPGPRAIVTHAGVIRVIMAHQKGLPLEQAFSIPVSYGQVISLSAA